uniref:Uncharacterized protein n=1 Tax=Rhizophora mucronata TaxID=61149 RepID=A0A2P2QDS1_RHIMU
MITGQSHSCGSFLGKTSQNLCIQFQILNQRQRFRFRAQPIPPALSSPSGGDESQIDPRYGVEKRLVPSGPNPLHN